MNLTSNASTAISLSFFVSLLKSSVDPSIGGRGQVKTQANGREPNALPPVVGDPGVESPETRGPGGGAGGSWLSLLSWAG